GDVHAAAFAFAAAGSLTEQLSHHASHIDTLRDAMAMTAMRTGNVVGIREVRTHAYGNGLFPRVEMPGTVQLLSLHLSLKAFLEGSNQHHASIQLAGLRGVDVHGTTILIRGITRSSSTD